MLQDLAASLWVDHSVEVHREAPVIEQQCLVESRLWLTFPGKPLNQMSQAALMNPYGL